MIDEVVPIACVLLAAAFGWAGVMKAVRAERWRLDLITYRLPPPLRAGVFVVLPWTELGIAVALVSGAARIGAALALAAVGGFCLAILRAHRVLGTNKLGCGCFGGTRIRDYRLLLLRNVVMGGLAAVVLFSGRDWSLDGGLTGSPSLLLPVLLVSLVAAFGLWIVWQLNERTRRRGQA